MLFPWEDSFWEWNPEAQTKGETGYSRAHTSYCR